MSSRQSVVKDGSSDAGRVWFRVGDLLGSLVAETGATRLYFKRGHTLGERAAEASVERMQIRALSSGHKARLLLEPSEVRRTRDAPFRVFSAFWRSTAPYIRVETPRPAPARIAGPVAWPTSESLHALGLLPAVDWAAGLRSTWRPGEPTALHALEPFSRFDAVAVSARARSPGSRQHVAAIPLSPLRRGWTSPGLVRSAASTRERRPRSGVARSIEALRRELGWREFATYLLYHLPAPRACAANGVMPATGWFAGPEHVALACSMDKHATTA